MRSIDVLLEEIYAGQERISRDEIYRRAVSADLPAEAITALDALPEGEYAQDEVMAALVLIGDEPGPVPPLPGSSADGDGVPAADLTDDDLLRELASLHRTRHETLLHASAQALDRHTERMRELEEEYLRRYPRRDVDPERLRSGARERG